MLQGHPRIEDKAGIPPDLERSAWFSGRGVAADGGRDGRGGVVPTILMGAHQLGGAPRPVAGSGEAENGGEVLGELLQARHETHVDAVLEVGPGSHHGNLLFLLRLPSNQLGRDQQLRQGSKNVPEEAEGPPVVRADGQSPASSGSLKLSLSGLDRVSLGASPQSCHFHQCFQRVPSWNFSLRPDLEVGCRRGKPGLGTARFSA